MADSQLMYIVYAWDELLEVLAGLFFFQTLMLNNNVEQLASANEFHDQVEVLFGFNNFIDLYNVGVVQLLENFDLPADSFDIFFVFDSWFLKNFYCNLYYS